MIGILAEIFEKKHYDCLWKIWNLSEKRKVKLILKKLPEDTCEIVLSGGSYVQEYLESRPRYGRDQQGRNACIWIWNCPVNASDCIMYIFVNFFRNH